MGRIRILSDNVSNKIAAGEVVERPASVVKELLENSLDAHSSEIQIHIESAGRRLIRIESPPFASSCRVAPRHAAPSFPRELSQVAPARVADTVAKAPREPRVSALTAKSRRNYGSRRTCRYGVNSRNAPTDLKFPCLLHPGWRAPAVLRPPLNP